MKQNITVEQLNELSGKGKKNLREWWWSIYDEHYKDAWDEYDEMPILSIGQMIEFLDPYTKDNDLNIRIHSAGIGWQTPGQRLVDINGLPVSEIEDEIELCDALWEAIKEILER